MDQCLDSLEHPEPLKVISHQIKGHWLLPACQNRFMCIHKASLMQTMCPPSAIFLLLLFRRMRLHMWDSLRHMYTHIISSMLHWHKQLFYSCFTRNMHVKQTVTPLLLRQYTRIKAFPRRAVTNMPQCNRAAVSYCYAGSGLSFPESLLAVKGLAFPLQHNKPISQGSALWLCFLSVIFDNITENKFILFYYTKDTACVVLPIVWIYFIVPSQTQIAFCLGLLGICMTDVKQPNGAHPFPLLAS